MKRMLINATQPEELRVAIADGQSLLNLDIEVPAQEQKRANIYKGRITRVEPSLEACFVNYGADRHGFLPLKEITPDIYKDGAGKDGGKVSIKDAVAEGQELIVQVQKEERGNKGAALSTDISLAGRYLVLMPKSPKSGGVSRQITGDDRKQLLQTMESLQVPSGMGMIVRTAGVGREAQELQWDLDYLGQLWAAIEKAASERKAPFLIYQESNLIIRALRDYLRDDIGEILVDDEGIHQDAREFMQLVMPHNLRKLKHYQGEVPLFTRFQIESQIETAFSRQVTLPSGGSLIIDHTEALLSIDINSARATKGADIEETALQTNLEAADEIARQLRIRDLGGLVVIDFIDMSGRGNQRQVEERLRSAMQQDRARVQTGRISKFGLMEMSRQRLRPSLGESSYITCPRCEGFGSIRSVESLALSMLRLLEEEAMKEHTGQIIAHAPTDVANFLLNEKRDSIRIIEKRHNVPMLIIANERFQTPRFEIQRMRGSEVADEASYQMSGAAEAETVATHDTQRLAAAAAQPAVSGIRPQAPAPGRRGGDGLLARLRSVVARVFGGADRGTDQRRSSQQKRTRGGRKNKQRTQTTKSAGPKQEQKQGKQQGGKGGKKSGKKRAGKQQQEKPKQEKQQEKQQEKPKQDQQQGQQQGKKVGKKSGKKSGASKTGQSGGSQQQGKTEAQQTAGQQTAEGGQTSSVKGEEKAGDQGQRQRRSRGRRGGRRRRSPYQTHGGDNKQASQSSSKDQQDNTDKTTQSAPDAPRPSDTGEQRQPSKPGKPTSGEQQRTSASRSPSEADSGRDGNGAHSGGGTESMSNEPAGDESAGKKRPDQNTHPTDDGAEPTGVKGLYTVSGADDKQPDKERRSDDNTRDGTED